MCIWRYSLVAIALACSSCAPTISTLLDGGVVYPYGPNTFNIHPLSRLAGPSTSQVTTAWLCIEFTDTDGQTTRATGTLWARIKIAGRPDVEQSFDLNNLSVNNDLWDRPTRMYQLRFQIDPPLVDTQRAAVSADVRWTPVNAGSVQRQGVLRVPEHHAQGASAPCTSDRISL
ncbi:MAG: hypothetical protein EXS17_04945 [Phycisphaerales bacterium]|nr:hypothetical protein [Phycisphaerales bacterium]